MGSIERAGVIRWWGPVAIYALALLVGASASPSSMPGGVSDGTLHAWGYAGFAVIILRAFGRGRWSRVSAIHALASSVSATAYGFLMEIWQLFVPGRFFDWRDLASDAVGAAAAGAMALIAARARHVLLRPGTMKRGAQASVEKEKSAARGR